MHHRRVLTSFLFLILLSLGVEPTLAQSSERPARAQPKKYLAFVPHYYPPNGCYPAEVKSVATGGHPPEVLLTEVSIKSFSDKPITAVKLGWNVYQAAAGSKKNRAPCGGASVEAEVILSGTTSLIELGSLFQNATCNIGTYPLKVLSHADKTVYIDQPLIMWEQVKSLTEDGTRHSFKEDYMMIVYVSEIRFLDGTKWEGAVR